jgi:hypothetical protein
LKVISADETPRRFCKLQYLFSLILMTENPWLRYVQHAGHLFDFEGKKVGGVWNERRERQEQGALQTISCPEFCG